MTSKVTNVAAKRAVGAMTAVVRLTIARTTMAPSCGRGGRT
jgi:hypothetical protein